MTYNADIDALSCPSCGHQDKVENLPADNKVKAFDETEINEYHCENCGAEVITDADTTATSCEFCGAAVVLSDRLSGRLAPDEVIPFTISKDKAREAFKKWCGNGKLTPNGFMTANRIKNITGIYVPFWLYDTQTRAYVRGSAQKVRTYSQGDYIYTETKHYEVMRDIDLHYSKVPTDASEKMDDDLMDKLEPYHYADLKEFKMPYLAGYIAEKYNFDAKTLMPRLEEKINPYIKNYVRSTLSGYSSTQFSSEDIHTKRKKAHYALMPVWMVYYDFNKSVHTFAMNGQTGKVVGRPPISKGKVAKWFAGITAGTFVAFKLFALIVGASLW